MNAAVLLVSPNGEHVSQVDISETSSADDRDKRLHLQMEGGEGEIEILIDNYGGLSIIFYEHYSGHRVIEKIGEV